MEANERTINAPSDESLVAYCETDRRLQDGLCANGCGQMRRVEESWLECPKCRFIWSGPAARATAERLGLTTP